MHVILAAHAQSPNDLQYAPRHDSPMNIRVKFARHPELFIQQFTSSGVL